MPSHEDGLGVALLEATVCKCMYVAIDSNGPRDILTAPALGWLTPAADEAALTDAVMDAAGLDEARWARMGAAARAHGVRRFDYHTQMRRIADLIVGS